MSTPRSSINRVCPRPLPNRCRAKASLGKDLDGRTHDILLRILRPHDIIHRSLSNNRLVLCLISTTDIKLTVGIH